MTRLSQVDAEWPTQRILPGLPAMRPHSWQAGSVGGGQRLRAVQRAPNCALQRSNAIDLPLDEDHPGKMNGREDNYDQGAPQGGRADQPSRGSQRVLNTDRGTPTDEELFANQLEAALASKEISPQLETIGIAKDYLAEQARAVSQTLWQQVAPEERRLLEAQADLRRTRSLRSNLPWYSRLTLGFPWRRAYADNLKNTEITAEAAVRTARDTLAAALREQSILPFIRSQLSDAFGASYSTELRVNYSPGLSEVFDPRYEITTKATRELSSVISAIRGGSIGLAGLRGSGKTTLIESICNGRIKSFARQAIACQVSAPVEYEPRDFILHMYAKICEALIGSTAAFSLKDASEPRRITPVRRSVLFRYATAAASAVGAVLIAIGILKILDVRVTWIGGALYIAIGAILQTLPIIAERIINTALSSVSLVSFGPWDDALDNIVIDLRDTEREVFEELRRRAGDLLDNIRYQQTYTSGWSGSLTAPVAAAALSRGREWARQPMTYPEVVASLRTFLGDIAARFRPVVIGIDELDKMESGEKARKFLNDIKGIFGIQGCYFFISVSVDAMSSFERRGMPFRDAFDSSFDDIVTVSTLTYEDARAIIDRRVIGLSNQFIALAYVVSGGIARDLIRAMRKVVTTGAESNDVTLRVISSALVADEIESKLAAVEVALQRDAGWKWNEKILDVRRRVRAGDEDSLIEAARRLGTAISTDEKSADESSRLAADLAAYLYFGATVLSYFSETLDEGRLSQAENAGLLEKFAECRQAFVLGAAEAWRRISDSRVALRLDVILPLGP